MSEKNITIGLLTSGGDAPGMNAAIRAVVRRGCYKGFRVIGIKRGYLGLLNEEFVELNERSVADILQAGGTMLGTERCLEMHEEDTQQKAADICRRNGIDSLIVIGGDGSFTGALRLAERGVSVIGVPGTIDCDIACTDYTIGFDTAINTAMRAIDNIRDTASSHAKCSMIEVMGRNSGYIALWSGLASGAEQALIPEKGGCDPSEIMDKVSLHRERGKKNNILINAEGVGTAEDLAGKVGERGGINVRTTVLSYIQRGGSPTCRDRVYASIMGAKAVDLIADGKANRVVAYKGDRFIDLDIKEALAMEGTMNENEEYICEIMESLSL